MSSSSWNKGTGGCKRGHDPELYVATPSGVEVCEGCKRENGAKYRAANKDNRLWKNRIQRYGITLIELDALFNKQRGACIICRKVFDNGNYHIDHDHETGEVRGLLCVACNTGLGLFRDSPERLQAAKEYIYASSNGVRNTSAPPPLPPARICIVYG